MALKQNARIFIIGHILDETRLAPLPAVGMGLVFLNLYRGGAVYTENEHRGWLNAAGFVDIDCLYGQGPNGATIITARKA